MKLSYTAVIIAIVLMFLGYLLGAEIGFSGAKQMPVCDGKEVVKAEKINGGTILTTKDGNQYKYMY